MVVRIFGLSTMPSHSPKRISILLIPIEGVLLCVQSLSVPGLGCEYRSAGYIIIDAESPATTTAMKKFLSLFIASGQGR